MRLFAQKSSGVLGGLCFYETFRTEKQRGFGGLCFYENFRTEKVLGGLCFYETFRAEKQRGLGGGCASMTLSHRDAAAFWGDCAFMRLCAQRSSGVLGGLCFYETFRAEKQRGFGGTVLL